MHIPDGYLNIPTCAAMFGIMAPVWYTAARKLKNSLEAKEVPLLAFGASFSFVLMMFNFPVLGGSSGHAVGGALLAILLGPWSAASVLSVVVAIQALLFHDGGITTFGANSFAMAFVLPFSSHLIYRILARQNSSILHKSVAGALSGYAGLTIAALATAIMLGIQPHGISGYAPYPLNVTIPAMVGSHLLVFSWVEGIVTGMVLAWIYKSFPSGVPDFEKKRGSLHPLWLAIFLLVILSPLGLLARGTAFGEWSQAELKKIVGYVPLGVKSFSEIWAGPFAGYRITGHSLLYGYLASAIIGSLAAGLFAFVIGKFLAKGFSNLREADENKNPTAPGALGLPEWLLQKENVPENPEKEKTPFLGEKLHKVGEFFSSIFFFEKIQQSCGFLQKRDPRVKVAVFFLFIFLSAWLKNPLLLLVLLSIAFLLGAFSGIPFFWFFKTVFLTMAFFSLIIALPASFQWISPGPPLFTIYWPYLVVTKPGALGLALFVLRTATAISFSALLGLTTSWTKLLKALQIFKVPKIFLFVVEMAYRYIFLFVRLLQQIHFSKKSRTISPLSLQDEQRWTAGRMAFLLQRSLDLSENVYNAMTARGYDGEIKTLDRFSLDNWDRILALGSALLFAAIFLFSLKGRMP